MPIHHASLEDLDGIVSLASEFLSQSRYQNLAVDQTRFRSNLRRYIRESRRQGRCLLIATSDDGGYEGFLMGGLSVFPFNEDKEAVELYFYVAPEYRKKASTVLGLLTAFREWAISHDAIEIRLATNSGIETLGYEKTLCKLGFRKIGAQYAYPLAGSTPLNKT